MIRNTAPYYTIRIAVSDRILNDIAYHAGGGNALHTLAGGWNVRLEGYNCTFGDIWCLFVSFGPAPHIYQRGERVGEPVCTIHGHCPESTWSSIWLASMVPGNMPHPLCLHIDPTTRPVLHGEVHMARVVGAI